MNRAYNFCAGPAMLPREVMERAQAEFLCYGSSQASVMELSHRSDTFMGIAQGAEANLRQLLKVPDDYAVLFCHGGGRSQFSAVPLNLAPSVAKAHFVNTGSWSRAAMSEAGKFVSTHQIAELDTRDPSRWAWQFASVEEAPAYLHYCSNETIDGVQLSALPTGMAVSEGCPVVADMSSDILSQPIDWDTHQLVYAGAQKNIGPAGLAIVIVKRDLLGRHGRPIPAIMDYRAMDAQGSMVNTPPTYAWYLAGLVFEWVVCQGGVDEMARRANQRSEYLYQAIDNNDFYYNPVPKPFRSKMNIPFTLAQPSLDAAFLQEAEAQGLMALAGHRSVGGMRASLYNAMPMSGVETLVDFMGEFARRRG